MKTLIKKMFNFNRKTIDNLYYFSNNNQYYDDFSPVLAYNDNVIVHRAVKLLAGSVASIPWLLYKKDRLVDSHILAEIVKRPNKMYSWNAFLELVVVNLLLYGNAYILNSESNRSIYSLHPDCINIVTDDGVLKYSYNVDGENIIFTGDKLSNLLHIKYLGLTDGLYGISPLYSSKRSILQYNAMSDHNISLLKNGGRPSGCLFLKNSSMNNRDRQVLRESLDKQYAGGSNAGKIFIAEGDMSWHEMGMSPKDLDYIEGKILCAKEIAQAIGVPFALLGMTDSTFANYKEARLHFWEDSVLPFLEYIISIINNWLPTIYDNSVYYSYSKENINALLCKRESKWQMINNANFLTINEKRNAFGYESVDGGDVIV